MDESQDRNDGSHAGVQGAGEQAPGTRSGEGAASAMQHVMAENERQQREEAAARDTGASHR